MSVTAGCARSPAKTKSHYGAKVPGKPKPSNAFLSEIQTKLSTRRDKVDREAYVVETPDHLVVVESLPPAGEPGYLRRASVNIYFYLLCIRHHTFNFLYEM